jgi:V/A-type H+-transporting ATPase subunit I
MGISVMQKVELGVHKDEKSALLERLQEKSILHIKDVRESQLKEEYPELVPQEEITDRETEDKLDYEKTGDSHELVEVCRKANDLESELTECDRTIGALRSQKEGLLPWQKLNVEVELIGSLKRAVSLAGTLTNPPENWKAEAENLPIDIEIVHEKPRMIWLLISYLIEYEEEIKKFMTDVGFEAISFSGTKGKPADVIQEIDKKIAGLEKRRGEIVEESKLHAKEIHKLFIVHDYHLNLLARKTTENLTFVTETAICIEGWIRAKDYQILEKIVNQFSTASVSKVEAEQGEEPPVELQNRKGLHVFEAITQLYSSPNNRELDPSPFLAPFFVVFFALCLTDAFYGLMFSVICLFLMKKVRDDRRLLWILFASGMVTIPIGAITGGWFGDFPQRFNLTGFMAFRESVLVFDPMKDPLLFFMIALGLGFVHVMFGFFLGFIKEMRQGKTLQAIAGKLAWIVFWIAILTFVLSSMKPGLSGLKIPCAVIAGLSALLVLFGSGGPSRSYVFSMAKGAFNLYQGLMGTVGDIISYSRLMALGLVTMGLATSINIMVSVMSEMPYIRYIAVPIIFVGGHVFSMAINVLGAYVHTLRLQYAEFFTKFFEGGGTPFKPFTKQAKYVIVEK